MGSSPRVQGEGWPVSPCGNRRRFIPACAGRGPGSRSRSRTGTVHPRVCGERSSTRLPKRTASGSSPRVRGEGGEAVRCFARHRFIPACAGRGTRRDRRDRGCPVHPRVCGERSRPAPAVSHSRGSSPRVRGEVNRLYDLARLVRFIPACAGRGHVLTAAAYLVAVHPRVCGERFKSWGSGFGMNGSSPRVRGEVRHLRAAPDIHRFIPACAGRGETPR